VFLGSLRAGLIVAAAIPLSMLFAFDLMVRAGVAGSLMSLGAIDFGLIVDSSVISVENSVRRLAEDRTDRSRAEIVREAALEVRRPTMFGELIILIVYLPILFLEGMEGKLFRPMALTVVFALAGSMLLSLTLIPVLSSLLLPRRMPERESLVVRAAKRVYRPTERLGTGEAAPAFAASRRNGTAVAISWPSPRPRLVHFWGTWCAPCRRELPSLLAFARGTPGVELVAVAIDDEWASIERFFGGEIPPEVVIPADAATHRRYGASTLPDSYLVDRTGRLVERYHGARDWQSAAAREHLQPLRLQPRPPVGADVCRGCQAQDLAPDTGPGRRDRAAGRGGRRGGRNRRWRCVPLQCSLQPAQRRGIAREKFRPFVAPRRAGLLRERSRARGAPQRPGAKRTGRVGSPVVQARTIAVAAGTDLAAKQ